MHLYRKIPHRSSPFMRYCIISFCCLLTGIVACNISTMAQVVTPRNDVPSSSGDTTVTVEILPGVRKLEFRKINDSTQLQILAGNVKLKQGSSLFFCDSCVINNSTQTFEAWGNVHINDADTANLFAKHLRYLIRKKMAYLDGNVKLTDGKGTLTTPDLVYDMDKDIGTYLHGGKVVNKSTVLTSQEGYYYAGIKDVYFKKNVLLKDPAYTITADSLMYNTQSQIASFIAKTLIKDSSGRTIETKNGYYNLFNGKAEFGDRPVIRDKSLIIEANSIINDDSSGVSQARGNVVIMDTAQHTTIIAGEVFRDNKRDRMLATRKPLMIIKQDRDSLYIAADSFYSARLTDLYKRKDSLKKDTVKGVKVVNVNKVAKNDSTNRYFEAYRNVRIFSDSLQGISDSLFYSFKDSTFRMYQRPVLWANHSQITGDTINLFTQNKKAKRIEVFDNSFIANQLDPDIFNQIKSTRMVGRFTDGQLDSVRATGLAQTIYFIQDEDSAYTGINESSCDIIDIYFGKKEMEKIIFRSQVNGTIWPMFMKDPKAMRLPNFIWLEDRRPKTKFDLFE